MLGYPNRRVIPKVSPGRSSSSIPSAKEASAEIPCLVSDAAFKRGYKDQRLNIFEVAMVRVLENIAYKRRTKELDLFSLEKGRKNEGNSTNSGSKLVWVQHRNSLWRP